MIGKNHGIEFIILLVNLKLTQEIAWPIHVASFLNTVFQTLRKAYALHPQGLYFYQFYPVVFLSKQNLLYLFHELLKLK